MSTTPITTAPLPASKKIHVEGTRPGVRVPMREISLSPTITVGMAEDNTPFLVYDTSGPYTDPQATIEMRHGLSPVRQEWILGRGDVEQLAAASPTDGQAPD